MIDVKDPGTIELPSAVRRPRGRPCKPDAFTPAQRAARYRARRAAVLPVVSPIVASVDADADRLLRAYGDGELAGRADVMRDVTELFDHMRLMRLRRKSPTVDQLSAWFAARSAES